MVDDSHAAANWDVRRLLEDLEHLNRGTDARLINLLQSECEDLRRRAAHADYRVATLVAMLKDSRRRCNCGAEDWNRKVEIVLADVEA